MSSRQAWSDAAPAGGPARGWRPAGRRISLQAREHAAVMSEFQRSRLLGAALAQASERGCNDTSVAAIITHAGVSRKTFYELFQSREECFTAVFEEAVAQIARVVGPVYASEGTWSERLRAALSALLEFLESNRDIGVFTLAHITGQQSSSPELRARVLGHLTSAVEEGRSQAKPREELSPLTGELVVGGALTVIDGHLRRHRPYLSALVNPLMWIIVLPYLGQAAAAKELQRTPPKPTRSSPARAPAKSRPARGPLEGLDMRVTYRTAMVLAAIGESPGSSNVEIAARVHMPDQGQISKLLARLARLKLVKNYGMGQARGAANAWRLTARGSEVDAAIRREFAFGERLRASR